MAIDDDIEALRKELENRGDSVSKTMLSLLSALPLPWPFNVSVNKVKERIHAEEHERIRVVLTTVVEILKRHRETLDEIRQKQSQTEHVARTEGFLQLLLDGARKASVTRSMERVKRIGLILANGITEPQPINEDEIEELMRVARELTDLDVAYLRELVVMEGGVVRINGRSKDTKHTGDGTTTDGSRRSWGKSRALSTNLKASVLFPKSRHRTTSTSWRTCRIATCFYRKA
jgi:hypothetical protein